MKNQKFTVFYFWLISVFLVSSFCSLIYLTGQQNYRQNANDPQIEVAEDTASQLNSGQKIETILPSQKVDPSQSLSPFIIVYNTQGQVTGSSVILNNQIPSLPAGVLNYVQANGEDRLTWQPDSSDRVAAVVTKYNTGYVLAARSLKEVEKRESNLFEQTALIWLASVLGLTILSLFYSKLFK